MYRYTTNMEVYVHHKYLDQKIGSCLIDRMLYLCDPTRYVPKTNCEYIVRTDYMKNGPEQTIKHIVFSFPHLTTEAWEPEIYQDRHALKDGPENAPAKPYPPFREWLRQSLFRFGFVQTGQLKHVGYRMGRPVDVSLFQYQTATNDYDAGIYRPNTYGAPVFME